jgi:hypothetical protein
MPNFFLKNSNDERSIFSWDNVYDPYNTVPSFPSQVATELKRSEEGWLALHQQLKAESITATNYIGLGSGVNSWISKFTEIIRQTDVNNTTSQIKLIDFAYRFREHKNSYSSFVNSWINTTCQDLQGKGNSFDLDLIGEDIFSVVPKLDLPENSVLEIVNLMSYVSARDLSNLLRHFVLPKCNVVVIAQEFRAEYVHLMSSERLADCLTIEPFLKENGFLPVYQLQIPQKRKRLDFAGIYVRKG